MKVSEKDLFKSVIYDELAPMNQGLCKFAQDLMEVIPDYFWTEPASSSGKHHPEYGLGEGGLARHSLMTYRWLKMLVEANETNMGEFYPGMVFASLFHDCCKRGLPDNVDLSHTAFEHPLLAAKFILDEAEKFCKSKPRIFEITSDTEESFKQDIAVAISTIETHMGRWNTNSDSNVTLPKPGNAMQYMVHLADYCASRKCTKFDVDWFTENLRTKD